MNEQQQIGPAEAALGPRLVERGTLGQADLSRALLAQRETGRKLTDVLTGLGLASESDIADALAALLDLAVVRREDYPLAPVLDGRIGLEFLKTKRILPIEENDDTVVLAMADPFDGFSVSAIEVRSAKRVSPRVALPSELDEALDRLYNPGRSAIAEIVDSLDQEIEAAPDDADRLRDLASEAPVIRLVNLLIAGSVEQRASDIHIEPYESRLRVRYRIDGELREVASHPANLRFAIISRIKIMAKLNIAERRLPQDGRIRLSVRGNEIELRVSSVPTDQGESVVLRVLDKSSVTLDFAELGFADDVRSEFIDLLARPQGIVLVTGPTGSGKTTTLYTALQELNAPTRKILTVEDPIEYQIEGISQIAIKPQIGLGFAEILRSILRQDPDVIMIGEIRDLETAQIAVQAALTGHTVLSTLHTNSAAATVTRLLDMGVESFLLTSTLSGIVAQRLVRRLCRQCKQAATMPPEVAAKLGLSRLAGSDTVRHFESVGCQACNGTGYRGRLCINEVLIVDQSITPLIADAASESDIQRAAVQAGMRPMYDAGLHRVLEGATTIAEVLRVTREV